MVNAFRWIHSSNDTTIDLAPQLVTIVMLCTDLPWRESHQLLISKLYRLKNTLADAFHSDKTLKCRCIGHACAHGAAKQAAPSAAAYAMGRCTVLRLSTPMQHPLPTYISVCMVH